MRQKRTEKVYAKVFHITNKNGNFTEEDFNLLKEKFETIRELYKEKVDIFPYDDNGFPPLIKFIEKDCYNSFRTIIKEIKRAAHNAGLKTRLLKVDYKASNIMIDITKTEEEKDGYYNLVVTFKSAANYNKSDDFIITEIVGLEVGNVVEEDNNGIYVNNYMKDDTDITYYWRGSK